MVGPGKSKSGSAILCNDPHLRMTLPSMFYLMHLASGANSESDRYETWGASMPGLPCIQLGQNRWLAWGITAALCDDVELYRERIHRIESDRYLAGEEWRKFAERRELIGIRGGKRHSNASSDQAATDRSSAIFPASPSPEKF